MEGGVRWLNCDAEMRLIALIDDEQFEVVRVDALPRTASNKVMHRVLHDRYATECAPYPGAPAS